MNPTALAMSVPGAKAGGLRADERRLILDQYQDVLAAMNLPPAISARLETLLADRVEAILDVEDSMMRRGTAQNSVEMAQAISGAIASITQQIVSLLGAEGYQQFEQLWSGAPVSAAAPATVVVVDSPEDSTAVSYETNPYYPFYYSGAFIEAGRSRAQRGEGRNLSREFRSPGARNPFAEGNGEPSQAFAPYFAVGGPVVNLENASVTGYGGRTGRYSGAQQRPEGGARSNGFRRR
jgi:hypothetical protein